MFFTGASSRFRLFSPSGYNIPKPRFLYFCNIVTDKLQSRTLKELSFFVKRIDRLQMSYDVSEMNQYNKKRLIQNKLNFGPLNISLHDTVDGAAFKLVEAYNRFYFGDFTNKSNSSWSYDVVGSGFEQAQGWGLKGNQTPNNANFISRIEIYEIFDQVYSQMNFINPKFTNVDMQSHDQSSSDPSELNITAKYEGFVFEAIAKPITQELANKWGLPFHNELFSGLLGGFALAGMDLGHTGGLSNQSIFSDVASILSGGTSAIGNIVNTVLNGVIPTSFANSTAFNSINGILGSSIGGSMPDILDMFPTSNLGGIFPDVQSRLDSGEPVRDISSGVFDVAGSLFRNLGF